MPRSYATSTSAPTSPASPSGSIQYNNSGVFGGSSNATLDGSGDMYLAGDLMIQGETPVGVYSTQGDASYFANIQTTLTLVADNTGAMFSNLGQFDSSNPAGRAGFIVSNSGDGGWYNNFVQFMVHGSEFPNTYYPSAIGSSTDAGKTILDVQSNGGVLTEFIMGSPSNIPISIFANKQIAMTVNYNYENDVQFVNHIRTNSQNGQMDVSGLSGTYGVGVIGEVAGAGNYANGFAFSNTTVGNDVLGVAINGDTYFITSFSAGAGNLQMVSSVISNTGSGLTSAQYVSYASGYTGTGYFIGSRQASFGISELDGNSPDLNYAVNIYDINNTGFDAGNPITGDWNISNTGNITAASFIKSGGTSAQFLKADGSVDSSTYLPYTTKGTATLVSGTKSITISGLTSSNQAFVTLATTGGTLGAMYKAVCTTNTLTITAVSVLGATVTTDTSTLNYLIV